MEMESNDLIFLNGGRRVNKTPEAPKAHAMQMPDERAHSTGALQVFPKSFADVESAISAMKQSRIVFVHLQGLDANTKIKVKYLLFGASFALDYGVDELPGEIFFLKNSKLQ